jgi:hypothetical protein
LLRIHPPDSRSRGRPGLGHDHYRPRLLYGGVTWQTPRRTWTPSTVKAHSRIANAESAFIAYSEDAAMSRSPAQAIAQYGQSVAIADLLTSRAAASEVEAAEAQA